MYKGFAIATVLIAFAVGFFAGELPKNEADNGTNVAEEAASNTVTEVATAAPIAPMPAPSDPSAPLASASEPTLTLGEEPASLPQSVAKSAILPQIQTRPAPGPGPLINKDSFPPGKVLTSTYQADTGS